MRKFLSITALALTMTVWASGQTTASLDQSPAGFQRDGQPSKGYVFGPGDEIAIKVVAEPDYNFSATIDENGTIEMPFRETPLMVRCMTERELREQVQQIYSKYLVNPQVTVKIEKRARPPVTVYGEVRTPKQIDLIRRATLAELVAFAGGPNEDAGGIIQVFRTQKPMCGDISPETNWQPETGDATEVPSRIYSIKAVNTGAEEANPQILPGDIIYVHKASPVYVTGEVLSPQAVLLKEAGTTVSEAISMVGGARREAKTKDVKIYRRKPGSKDRDVLVANLDLIKKGLQKDIALEAYDIVEVDKARKSIALTILEFAVGAGRSIITSAANQTGVRVVY